MHNCTKSFNQKSTLFQSPFSVRVDPLGAIHKGRPLKIWTFLPPPHLVPFGLNPPPPELGRPFWMSPYITTSPLIQGARAFVGPCLERLSGLPWRHVHDASFEEEEAVKRLSCWCARRLWKKGRTQLKQHTFVNIMYYCVYISISYRMMQQSVLRCQQCKYKSDSLEC